MLLVPAIFLWGSRTTGAPADTGSRVPSAVITFIVAAVVGLCYVLVTPITLKAAASVKLPLAVSLAHFFIGLTCIVTQRSLLKQAFGYCLMENGSHLTLALLAARAPEIIEIGIATDAVFAVLIMVVLARQIDRLTGAADGETVTTVRG